MRETTVETIRQDKTEIPRCFEVCMCECVCVCVNVNVREDENEDV
jgi:hypothetical protein